MSMARRTNSSRGGTPAPASQRALRVGELVRHALAEILARGEIDDEFLAGTIVSVPEVRMTPDLSLATCFVMPLGGGDATAVVEALDRHRKFLRGEVAHRINLRHAPDLRFRVDTSFETGARIDALLGLPAVRRDVEAAKGDDDAEE